MKTYWPVFFRKRLIRWSTSEGTKERKSTTASHVRPARAAEASPGWLMSAVTWDAPGGGGPRLDRFRTVTAIPRLIASRTQAVLMMPEPPMKRILMGVVARDPYHGG